MSHPQEIVALAAPYHSSQRSLLASAYVSGNAYTSTVWKLPEIISSNNNNSSSSSSSSNNNNNAVNVDSYALSKQVDFQHTSRVQRLLWAPEDTTSIFTVTQDTITQHKLDAAQQKPAWSLSNAALFNAAQTNSTVHPFTAGVVDPHHASLCVATAGNHIASFDTRSSKVSHFIENAHSQRIEDVDYNPNKLHHIVTAGHDRRIRFWDLRKPNLPLKILTGHTHWIYSVKYNRFHDQLICSAGADAQVNLWSVLSISSAPVGDLEEHGTESIRDGDKLIKSFQEQEESVYSVAWSAADAWVFGSVSYDGRVVFEQVPAAEKYKILL